jgi:hypothetical protein
LTFCYFCKNKLIMLTLSPKYITDEQGNRISVVLSIEDFFRIVEELEELEDVRLYDEVKSRNEPRIPLSDYLQQRQNRR